MPEIETRPSVSAGSAVESGGELMSVRAGGLKWRVRKSIDPALVSGILSCPEDHLDKPALQFKSSRVVTVTRVPAPAPGLPDLVLRRLNYGKLKHRLRDFLRPTRAERALGQGLRLEDAGVRTPRAFAATAVRCCRWPVGAYLVTEQIVGAQTLGAYLGERKLISRGLVFGVADLLASLHERGFSHRDLKATNLLVDLGMRPWLIDLDGLREGREVGERRVALDLARFAGGLRGYPGVVRGWGWRFLVRYCGQRRSRLEPRRLGLMILGLLGE